MLSVKEFEQVKVAIETMDSPVATSAGLRLVAKDYVLKLLKTFTEKETA